MDTFSATVDICDMVIVGEPSMSGAVMAQSFSETDLAYVGFESWQIELIQAQPGDIQQVIYDEQLRMLMEGDNPHFSEEALRPVLEDWY